jgi:hypothetical protein
LTTYFSASGRLSRAEPGFTALAQRLDAVLLGSTGADLFDPASLAATIGASTDQANRLFYRGSQADVGWFNETDYVECPLDGQLSLPGTGPCPGGDHDIPPNAVIVRRYRLTAEAATESGVAMASETRRRAEEMKRTQPNRSPWNSGSFYAAVVVGGLLLLLLVAGVLRWIGLSPIWSLMGAVIFGVVAFIGVTIVGAFQLRQDEKISERGLIELVRLGLDKVVDLARDLIKTVAGQHESGE